MTNNRRRFGGINEARIPSVGSSNGPFTAMWFESEMAPALELGTFETFSMAATVAAQHDFANGGRRGCWVACHGGRHPGTRHAVYYRTRPGHAQNASA